MKVKACLIFLIVALNTACATKQTTHSAKEINEECGFEMHAARTAIRLRDKGKSKTDLLSKLPPLEKNSSRLLQEMHEITNEVYRYPDLNQVVYSTYRFELCQRQMLRKPIPASIQVVLPLLLNCQQQFGNKSSVKSTNCILAAVKDTSNREPITNTGVTNVTDH